jgi:hypothetical protein
MVQDIVEEMQLDVPVRHIAYTTIEAHQIAAKSGLLPGTAKDVAKRVASGVDWDRVYALTQQPSQGLDQTSCCGSPAQNWSPALDEALRPCEEKSGEAGILMTPVLVINGEKIHSGSVPGRLQVAEWIRQAFDAALDRPQYQDVDVIEILGTGCEKCDTLYARVAYVLSEMGIDKKVHLKKRSDVGYFAEKGVSMTPGLVINGQVASMGRVLDSDLLRQKIIKHLKIDNKNDDPYRSANKDPVKGGRYDCCGKISGSAGGDIR